jgi:hypothetical protein
MVQTISWMVQREDATARTRIGRVAVRWFLAGGAAGGAFAGLAITALAALIAAATGEHTKVWAIAAACVAVLYAAKLLGATWVPKPQISQQVPSSWREVFPLRVASFIYASGLGVFFMTRIGSLVVYPTVILVLGMGGYPLAPIGIFALAGFVRAATAITVPVFEWAGAEPQDISTALDGQARVIRRLELPALIALATALIACVAVT